MPKSVVFLDENEIDKRIHNAVAEIKNRTGAKIYGVSGMGSQNPIWTRTYDAAGITLNISQNGSFKECVASDSIFQEFFKPKKYIDEHGNHFLTFTPKSYRIDRTSSGEITALSIKEYEDGDEEKGFKVYDFFKNWISETEYDGIVSRDVAQYLSSCYDTANEEIYSGYVEDTTDISSLVVRSVPDADFNASYAPWKIGTQIIKNTDPRYGKLSWMFLPFFRDMCAVYFARSDIHQMFDIFDGEQPPFEAKSCSTITGETDTMNSHTGFDTTSNHYRIFDLDHALAGVTVDGCYQQIDGFYYSRLFDFDISSTKTGIRTSIDVNRNIYGEDFDTITKIKFDPNNPDIRIVTARRKTTVDFPEGTVPFEYYSCKEKVYDPGDVRGQLFAFGYDCTELLFDNGIYYGYWDYDVVDAWCGDDDCALRLCKSPS